MSKHNSYDPEHVRSCRGCCKQFKTKDGVLENKYKFNCVECWKWYRTRDRICWGVGIPLGLIILVVIIYYWLKNSD